MVGENTDNTGGGPVAEQSTASGDQTETIGQGSQAPPPPEVKSGTADNGGPRSKTYNILLAACAAAAVVALILSAIALGFAVEDRHDVNKPREMMQRRFMNRPNAGQLRGELKDLAEGGQVSIIRGNVGTVEGGNVTVQTPTGNETVVITDSTSFRGPGLAGEQAGASSLTAGKQVTVVAKKTTDGKLEAMVVNVGAENTPSK
jgi:hypothetical protein